MCNLVSDEYIHCIVFKKLLSCFQNVPTLKETIAYSNSAALPF